MFEFSHLAMAHLTEVGSLGVKAPYQTVGMLIQATFPGMVWACKVDLRPCDFRDLLVQGEFRAVICGQGLKLAEGIGFNVPESGSHGLRQPIAPVGYSDKAYSC